MYAIPTSSRVDIQRLENAINHESAYQHSFVTNPPIARKYSYYPYRIYLPIYLRTPPPKIPKHIKILIKEQARLFSAQGPRSCLLCSSVAYFCTGPCVTSCSDHLNRLTAVLAKKCACFNQVYCFSDTLSIYDLLRASFLCLTSYSYLKNR